ncbi:MAG: hypothetical protein AUK33_11440 [Flavobacteriaceae bacterium CG2_30_34_30]|nr:MAG: hypothetical protein AUK33_11440 [Flavobacteriaceae bacterium CG2_30_34_30]
MYSSFVINIETCWVPFNLFFFSIHIGTRWVPFNVSFFCYKHWNLLGSFQCILLLLYTLEPAGFLSMYPSFVIHIGTRWVQQHYRRK